MLDAAFVILGIAVLLGAALFVMHLRTSSATASVPRRFAALHGLIGIGGLACLILALRVPPARIDTGTAGFGAISVAVLAVAAFLGAGIFVLRLANKRAGALIGIHATLAIGGFVILAAYVLV